MDNLLSPERQNAIIEDALNSYPLAPVPRDITADVMSHIHEAPAARPFRLEWSDLILSLALAICVGAVWFSLQSLPPLAVAQIRKERILLYQQILLNLRWLIPAFSFGFAGLLALSTIPYLRRELMRK